MASIPSPEQASSTNGPLRVVPPNPPEKDRRPPAQTKDSAREKGPYDLKRQASLQKSNEKKPSLGERIINGIDNLNHKLDKAFTRPDDYDQSERARNFHQNQSRGSYSDYPQQREVIKKEMPSANNSKHGGRKIDRPYNPTPWEMAQITISQQAQLIHQQEETILQLQKSLGEQHQTVIQVKESANKMQLAMDNKELYIGQQASDDVLIGKFAALMRSIKTWSQLFPRNITDNLDICLDNEEIEEEVLQVLPGCRNVESLEKMLLNSRRRRLFIRGWIGLIVTKHFFRSLPDEDFADFIGIDTWLKERVSESVGTLETVLYHAGQEKRPLVSAKELHDWRALTMNLLSGMISTENLSVDLEDFLQSTSAMTVAAIRKCAPETTREDLEGGLISIFRDAVKLSRLFRCQRAYWFVRFPMIASSLRPEGAERNPAMLFDDNRMEDSDDREGDEDEYKAKKKEKVVEVIVQPSLMKRGNAEGENFDRKAVIQKALVSCY